MQTNKNKNILKIWWDHDAHQYKVNRQGYGGEEFNDLRGLTTREVNHNDNVIIKGSEYLKMRSDQDKLEWMKFDRNMK